MTGDKLCLNCGHEFRCHKYLLSKKVEKKLRGDNEFMDELIKKAVAAMQNMTNPMMEESMGQVAYPVPPPIRYVGHHGPQAQLREYRCYKVTALKVDNMYGPMSNLCPCEMFVPTDGDEELK